MKMRILAVLAATAVVAACGGGGGGSVTSMSAQPENVAPSSDITAELAGFRELVGGESLNLTSGQIHNILRARQGEADRMLSTDVLSLSLSGRAARHVVTCAGAICSTEGRAFSPSDIDFSDPTYISVMTRNGVSMAYGDSRAPIGDSGADQAAESYGGWLEHNAFFVERDSVVSADNVAQSVDIYALSIGSESGSNPVSGSATWRGTMAGMDTIDIQFLHGDTELTADFASSDIDVAFTGIYDDESQPRTDILWSDVPLVSGGFFSRGIAEGDKIEGTFYGPNHEEVGGVFEHGYIVGAFGAKRQ